jgi:hypothetical protein
VRAAFLVVLATQREIPDDRKITYINA